MATPSLADLDAFQISSRMHTYRPLPAPSTKTFKAVKSDIPISVPSSAPIQIPLVATPEFIASGCYFNSSRGHKFQTYPHQLGLDMSRLNCGDFGQYSPFFMLAVLQQWLYFGMLEEVTGYPVDWDDVIGHDEQGNLIVDQNAYKKSIIYWYNRLGFKYSKFMVLAGPGYNDDDPYQQSLETSLACITKVRAFVTRYQKQMYKLCTPIGAIVHLSILMLGERLQNGRDRIADVVETVGDRIMLFQSTESWGPAPILEDKLKENGWCVGEVKRIASSMNVCNQYFASFLRLLQKGEHERCSVEKCKANHISEPFLGKHATCCDLEEACQFQGVESQMETIVDILRAGGIPVIEMTVNPETKDVHLLVLKADTATKYTAISHVWSDGLGNSERNEVHRCQLLYLYKSLRGLADETTGGLETIRRSARALFQRRESRRKSYIFWLDTLCIPVAPKYKECRKTAIKLMAKTYQNAQNVLVLDGEMKAASVSQSREELVMRLYCSAWMRRLWTLQEGVLASKKLYVQLSNGVVNVFDSMWKKSYNKAYSGRTGQTRGKLGMFKYFLQNGYEYESLVHLSRFLRLSDRSGISLDQRFAYAWDEVRWRYTSRQSDETICFAGILGLPTTRLLEVTDSAEARMKNLLSLLDVFPTTILFTAKPHMTQDGWKWVPALFPKAQKSIPLELPRSYYYHERAVSIATRCETGLRVALSGLLLAPRRRFLSRRFTVIFESFCWNVVADAEESDETAYWQSPRSFGVVLSDGIPADKWIQSPRLAQAQAPRWAVLVEVENPEDGANHTFRASYIDRLQVQLMVDESTPPQFGPDPFETAAALARGFEYHREDERNDRARALICPKNQKWCIG